MARVRVSIPDFQLANPIYAGATVTFWTVSGGVKTVTKATLYDAQTGTGTLTNPVTLDGEGKFKSIPYIEEDVIASVSGLSITDHDTGIMRPPLDQSDLDAAIVWANQASGMAGLAANAQKAAKASEDAAAASAAAAAASAAETTAEQTKLIAESYT